MRIASALVGILGLKLSLSDRVSSIAGLGMVSVVKVGAAVTERPRQDAVDFQIVDGNGGDASLPSDDEDGTRLNHEGAVQHEDDAAKSSSFVSTCEVNEGISCASSIGVDNPRLDVAFGIGDDDEGIAVETGTQEGTSIEFIGKARGTIPGPIPQSQQLPQQKIQQQQTHDGHEAEEQKMVPKQQKGVEGFERLQCMNRDTVMDGSNGAESLTLTSICSNMLQKLMYSGQQQDKDGREPILSPKGRGETVGKSADALAEGSTGEGSSLAQHYLAVLTMPAWYLFGFLGSMPGWFSEALFTVSVRDGAENGELSQRLLLVQTPPRFLQITCALLSPSLSSSSGSAPWLERLARRACHLDSPFPGKSVSRPCLTAEPQALSWIRTTMQEVLAVVGADDVREGGRKDAEGSGGSWSGACRCGSAGVGPCTVRAVPGRDPCVYLEVDRSTRAGQRRGQEARDGDATAVSADSSVDLPTYTLPLAKEGSPSSSSSATKSPRRDLQESPGSRALATGMDTLDAWRTTAAEHGVPSSVTVPTYVARLVVGAAFLFLARPLSESRLFHYVLSALLGGVFAVMALVFRTLCNPQQALPRVIFFGALLGWVLLAVGGNFVPSPAYVILALPGNMLAFWESGFGGFAWAGKAFYAASALVGVIMTRWQGLFLDEDEGWFNGQASIRRILMVSGAWLVFSGVSDPEIGSVLVLVALSAPSLAHCVRRYDMWSKRSRWYRAGPKLSHSEYERQGDEYTRRALEALQNSAGEDWRNVRKQVKTSTRKRMAAFIKTGEHYGQYEDDVGGRGGWGMSCTLQ